MVQKKDLLKTLEGLRDEEFEDFKCLLKYESLAGYQTIKASQLQNADRWDIVDLMVKTYQLPGAAEVTEKLLEKINRNDLLQSSGPEATTQRDVGSTTSTVRHGSVTNRPQMKGVYVGGNMDTNVSNTHAPTQTDAGSTTSTVQHGSVINEPQMTGVYVGGNMDTNVGNTHVQPPAKK